MILETQGEPPIFSHGHFMSPYHLKDWCLGNKSSDYLCGTPEKQKQGQCEEMEERRRGGLNAGSLSELSPLSLPTCY